MTILAIAVRAERVAKKVEGFAPGIPNAVFASLRASPSLVIACRAHANASSADLRLRMTKSSA
jgi:hypothetical protein